MKHKEYKEVLQEIKKRTKVTSAKFTPKSLFEIEMERLNNFTIDQKERLSCTCHESNGESKFLYSTYKEAQTVSSLSLASLVIYPCPLEQGWHLTKKWK